MNHRQGAEIARFLLVGVLSFLMDYGLLFLFTEEAGIDYFWSAAASFTLSFLFNWWANVVWVFRAKHRSATQAGAFLLASAAGLALNQASMWLLVEIAGLHYLAAKIFATGAVSVWNYLSRRKILVKGEKK